MDTHTHTPLCKHKTLFTSCTVLEKLLSSMLSGIQNNSLTPMKARICFRNRCQGCCSHHHRSLMLVVSLRHLQRSSHSAVSLPAVPVLLLVRPCLPDILPPPEDSPYSPQSRLRSPPPITEGQFMPPSPTCLPGTFRDNQRLPSICSFCPEQSMHVTHAFLQSGRGRRASSAPAVSAHSSSVRKNPVVTHFWNHPS